MRYRCVLFDLDGTLADTRRGIVAALQHALRRFGRSRPEAELLCFIGPPLQEVFSEGLGLAAREVEGAVAAYREYYEERGLYEAEVYPGIEELLRSLSSAEVPLAVATSKPETYARRMLDHFGLAPHFRAVSGPELDGTRRHKPEVIEHVLARLGQPPRETTAMVGDRVYDVEGARRAGLSAITVAWGFGAPEELAAARADAHASSPAELHRLLLPGPPA